MSGPAECSTNTHSFRPPNVTGLGKVALDNCLIQQNVIKVHITPVLQCYGTNQSSAKSLSDPAEDNTGTHNSRPPYVMGQIEVMLNKCLVQQNVIQVHITPIFQMPRDQSK